jgi:nitroreductase
MNFIDIVKKRCSVREYSSQPVEKEKLDYVLEAARLAPSACNLQPWSFYIIQDAEMLQKLRSCYVRESFKTAPVFIAICGNHETSWKRKMFDNKDHCDIDVAITTQHLIFAATEVGLGTCWVCNFDPVSGKEMLQLSDSEELIALIPIGYPVKEDIWETTVKNRKEVEEIVFYK